MVDAIKKVQQRARKAIEATYFGTLTVTEMQKVKDEESKLTKKEEVVTLENQPCRLSFETLKSADQTVSAANITQVTKLFISPDVEIKPGSKLTVTQDGVTTAYVRSGFPAVYPTHQEIILDLFEKYA